MAKRESWSNAEARRAWRRIRADCSEEMGALLDALELTPEQRETVAGAVRLAQAVALTRGRAIGSEEALKMIADTWLADRRG